MDFTGSLNARITEITSIDMAGRQADIAYILIQVRDAEAVDSIDYIFQQISEHQCQVGGQIGSLIFAFVDLEHFPERREQCSALASKLQIVFREKFRCVHGMVKATLGAIGPASEQYLGVLPEYTFQLVEALRATDFGGIGNLTVNDPRNGK